MELETHVPREHEFRLSDAWGNTDTQQGIQFLPIL